MMSMRCAVVVLAVLALSSCLNPAGSSSGRSELDLPDGNGEPYEPVGAVPEPGNGGELNVAATGHERDTILTVRFDEAHDLETARGDLEYALYVSLRADIERSEDLWASRSNAATAWRAYPAGGGLSVSLRNPDFRWDPEPGPVYLNVGVRDEDGNVSAYQMRYWAPPAVSASYVVHPTRPEYLTTGETTVTLTEVDGDIIYILTNVADRDSDPVRLNTGDFLPPGGSSAATTTSVHGSGAPVGGETAGTDSDEPRPPGIGVRGFPGQHDPVAPVVRRKTDDLGTSALTGMSAAAQVGDTDRFQLGDSADSRTIEATAVSTAVSGEWNLTVWLDSNDDTGLTREMVEQLSERFMTAGTHNDIFDWVTGVYGDPWGPHTAANVLAGSRRDIHILLYDIDGDGDDVPFTGATRTVGYFWSKDNLSGFGGSNHRLMFYMDSALLATKTGVSWQIDDYWPAEIVSTLAHELQHMIHYYQREVIAGVRPETWVNETASLVAEDIVSRHVGVNGPRGVEHTVGGAGGRGNRYGRIPGWVDSPLTQLDVDPWENTSSTILDHYSAAYTFGAVLLRRYGAEVFRNLLTGGATGRQAFVDAVRRAGDEKGADPTATFDTLLRDWAVSMLLSDDIDAPGGYRINTGDWIDVGDNGGSYEVGSINVHNYGTGFPLETDSRDLLLPPASSVFVQAATDHSGGFSDTVSLPEGIDLTVVERR